MHLESPTQKVFTGLSAMCGVKTTLEIKTLSGKHSTHALEWFDGLKF